MQFKIPSALYCFLFFYSGLAAQIAPEKYAVEFTDKNDSPYSIDHPEAFLSQRAILRRERYGIAVTLQDFPVNPQYIQAVKGIGVKILQQTKWLNAIVIKTIDTSKLTLIEQLPFVRKITKSRPAPGPESAVLGEPWSLNKPGDLGEQVLTPGSFTGDPLHGMQGLTDWYDYGEAFSQIAMLGGIPLHNEGFHGEGVGIAILDGGFSGTNTMAVFDSLRANGQIMGTLNLVGGGTYVYQGTTHGSAVLSILAAYAPGLMIGTAPKSLYWLIRTEDTNSEYMLEEYNWATGAEYADSAGADLISSSLVYRSLMDPSPLQTYEQTDGHTAPVTIAAGIAMDKGMIVVNSAGNSAEDWTWPYIGFPSDGDSVLTVGAVDAHGTYASFSSVGPTIDGRVKPDLTARGIGTVIADETGGVSSGDGTSFSTPLIAGMIACLWQAFPAKNNMEILEAVKKTGSRFTQPDTLQGSGVPDFSKSYQNLLGIENPDQGRKDIVVSPNPFRAGFRILFPLPVNSPVNIELFDMKGTCLLALDNQMPQGTVLAVDGLPVTIPREGIFMLRIITQNELYLRKLIRQ